MQGFILSMQTIKNQDLILKILTPSSILELYRFYGLRHSILALGKHIDFEVESNGLFLPKLRNIIELSYPWEREYARGYVWQIFLKMLDSHLKGVSEIESFYFDTLRNGAHRLIKQNPMRVILEMGAELIAHEGRNVRMGHNRCFICDEILGDQVSLGRAFLFAHPECIGGKCFQKTQILHFLETYSSLTLSDSEIEDLWEILILGL